MQQHHIEAMYVDKLIIIIICIVASVVRDCVERGSSVVECRTLNRESPGSNPHLLPFRSLGIYVLFTMPQFAQL